jgi:hypothetical protein
VDAPLRIWRQDLLRQHDLSNGQAVQDDIDDLRGGLHSVLGLCRGVAAKIYLVLAGQAGSDPTFWSVVDRFQTAVGLVVSGVKSRSLTTSLAKLAGLECCAGGIDDDKSKAGTVEARTLCV